MWTKLYGERNTNTNYLGKLLELNVEVDQLPGVVPKSIFRLQNWLPGDERVRDWYFAATFGTNLGWKHASEKSSDELLRSPLVSDKHVGFITVTKNPYSWLLSLYRRPYSLQVPRNISFEDFLTTRWQTTGRDNLGRRTLSSPIELWNLKNASYLLLAEAFLTVQLTSEAIFLDASNAIDQICRSFGLSKRTHQFQNYEQSTKDSTKDSHYYRDYYVQEKWRKNLSKTALALINARIDTDLMRRYGYELIA